MNQSSDLKRAFGLPTAVFLVVASMIGSGVLTSTGYLLQRTPNLQVVMALWIVGGVIALCGALTMAEMATAFPEVGGDYVYVREAFGPRIAFMYGCAMVVVGFAAPVAMVAYTLASLVWSYCQNFAVFAGMGDHYFCLGFAVLSILILTVIHVRGHQESAIAQGLLTLFKILVFVGFIVLGLNSEAGQWSHFQTHNLNTDITFSGIAANLILVMYCYTGWNGAVYIAGEIKNPSRNLTSALIFGTALVTLLYLGLNIVYGYAIDPQNLSRLSENEVLMFAETANKYLFSTNLAKIFSILIGVGVIASLSSFIMTGPRIVYAMAKDGLVPARLGKSCKRTQIPKAAIWCQSIISIILLLSNSFQFMLDFAGYGLGVLSLMIIFPIFWLRKKANYKPSFMVPLYPWLPVIFIVMNFAMLVMGAVETPIAVATSMGAIAAPFLMYPLVRKNLLRRRS